jgi:hypothetical protein
MPMTDFSQVQARLAGTNRDIWLGRLVWYSVSEVSIAHDELVRALSQCNIHNWPRPPSDVDVFRRICTSAQRKRVAGPNDTTENYLIRDLPMDAERVHKVLVKETVAQGGLTYKTQLCAIDFVKATSMLEIVCNGEVVAMEIADEIRRKFAADKGTINSYGVRELIRKILTELNATNVRGGGGGVYFVAEEHGEVVDNLEKLAKRIPGMVLVHSLPLLDDSKQREMLKRAYESETTEEAHRMVNELAELEGEAKAGTRKITSERVAHYVEALHQQRRKAKEYKKLLETSLDTAEAQLNIFQQQVMQLMTMVEE